tara:strand:- start:231 stop:452 length:222 start_codon:yes stop_codon:yes gene_type:complete
MSHETIVEGLKNLIQLLETGNKLEEKVSSLEDEVSELRSMLDDKPDEYEIESIIDNKFDNEIDSLDFRIEVSR